MSQKRAFGELELAVLNILKSNPEASVKDVHEKLGGKNAYTTVMTVMNRLVEKKELRRKRAGQRYVYDIIDTHQSPSVIERLKQRMFGGRSFAMISYLLESSDTLSEEELFLIEKKISDAKRGKRKS